MSYLDIKNWAKFQSLRGGGKWIKDYTEQADDEGMSKLSLFQRMVLQSIRRIRGKLGKPIPNDPHYICNQMNALRTDRPRVKNAIDTLIEQQWLTVMGSIELAPEQPQRIERREKRKEIKPSAPKTGAVESRHTRIKTMVQNAYQERNQVPCPWDGGEGKQLKALLDSTPGWHDSQIAQCLANLYDTTGFAKGTRPREWLSKLPKYLNGPLNEFNREQANGQRKIELAGHCKIHPNSGTGPHGECWGCYSETPAETLKRIRENAAKSHAAGR